MTNPAALYQSRDALRALVNGAHAESEAESYCGRLKDLNRALADDLFREKYKCRRLRACLMGAAAYGAFFTLASAGMAMWIWGRPWP